MFTIRIQHPATAGCPESNARKANDDRSRYDRIDSEHRRAYLGVVTLLLAVLWSADVISVITYASQSIRLLLRDSSGDGLIHAWSSSDRMRSALFGPLGLLMVGAAVFGSPAEAR